MSEREGRLSALLPAVAMVATAALVWLAAADGRFRSVMAFPLIFAAVTTAIALLSLFVGRRRTRRSVAITLAVGAALGWGAVWSHAAFFSRELRAVERSGAEAWVGKGLARISYLRAVNTPGTGDGPGELALDAPQTLVNVWAPWCGNCLGEMPALERFWTERRADGAQVVGVTRYWDGDTRQSRAEEWERIAALVAERGVSYPVLAVDDATYERFMAERLPTSLWVEQGKVRGYRAAVAGTESLVARIERRLDGSPEP